jgi:hypothetical protein
MRASHATDATWQRCSHYIFPSICAVPVRFQQADDTVTPEVSRARCSAAFKFRWLSSRRTVTLKSGQPDSDGP